MKRRRVSFKPELYMWYFSLRHTGMLTFIMYYLMKNPEAMRTLREEIDTKIGDRPVTVKDVHQLPYLLGKRSTKLSCLDYL